MRLSSSAVIELIRPVGLCFAEVLVTTSVLSTIDSFVPTEHLMLGYLLPTLLVAIYFGSTSAVLTSFAGGLSAAYFLLPPKFSFYIDDPLHIAELGFTILLAVIASKVVGALASGSHRQARIRADEVSPRLLVSLLPHPYCVVAIWPARCQNRSAILKGPFCSETVFLWG
jgi:K+-sensing histidine kinase KdpD